LQKQNDYSFEHSTEGLLSTSCIDLKDCNNLEDKLQVWVPRHYKTERGIKKADKETQNSDEAKNNINSKKIKIKKKKLQKKPTNADELFIIDVSEQLISKQQQQLQQQLQGGKKATTIGQPGHSTAGAANPSPAAVVAGIGNITSSDSGGKSTGRNYTRAPNTDQGLVIAGGNPAILVDESLCEMIEKIQGNRFDNQRCELTPTSSEKLIHVSLLIIIMNKSNFQSFF
jgi:hypothetical protein